MRLESKGEIRPPPKLKGPAQSVSLEIQSWPGIIAATHWFLYDRTQVDGADFYVGEKELGHIHLDGELHLFVTVGLRRRLIEAGLAEALPWPRIASRRRSPANAMRATRCGFSGLPMIASQGLRFPSCAGAFARRFMRSNRIRGGRI
jgi:hypothetical protein